MLNKILLSTDSNPDLALFPLILILLSIALIVVVIFVVWEIFINKKSIRKTTVITVTDEDEIEPNVINSLEDIEINNEDETK